MMGHKLSLQSFMFVHKVARDSKFIVAFDESKCYVLPYDLRDVKVLEIARKVGGLYYFDKCQDLVIPLIKFCSRLSHPFDQVLYVLKNDIVFENDNDLQPCEICQKAKQTREPFPLNKHKSIVLAKLVHHHLDL
ncbi:hypothetical protein Tco_0284953 [Tanacetum coccineum]